MKNYIILLALSLIIILFGLPLFLVDDVVIKIISGIILCSGFILVFSLLIKISNENARTSLQNAPIHECPQT